jgi:hypothetical protein
MGLALLLKDAADGLKWAQWCSSVALPITLNGPSLLLRYSADVLEWAQHFSSDMLSTAMNGPNVAPQ